MMQTPSHKTSWQQQLIDVVTDPHELLELLSLTPEQVDLDPNSSFVLRVPRDFVSRMQPNNPRDPLLLQALPQTKELIQLPGYSPDPLNEQTANKTPSLLHKYGSRVLLIATGSCAINCRFCFRRQFPYQENRLSKQELSNVLQYIQNDPEIIEVILSGGDPMVLKDESLAQLVNELATLPQLKYLRLHTRLPVMIPERVTDDLVTLLSNTRLKTTVVIHSNHPNEISDKVGLSLVKLSSSPISVLNQSVLLKGINDDAETLATLSHRLYRYGVVPYYLHLLDPVHGTAHFDVSEEKGREIVRQLQASLPGYLVPRFVKEVAGEKSKTWIGV